MKLVIVESPAKAKTINKYLGSDYEVIASFGHIRDLEAKEGSVLPDKDFEMVWQTTPQNEKHIRAIITALNKADALYLASDPDREGEAISWHIIQELSRRKKLPNIPVYRITFNEITKSAVLKAVQEPREIDMPLVEAYLARRALDYLVGFNLSPVLWRKLPGSRSAGRVQSVALRLICDREKEREDFVSREYWTIDADFKMPTPLRGNLTVFNGKKCDKFEFTSSEDVQKAVSVLENLSYHIEKVEKKQEKRNPAPAFTTSTLQQEASRKLGFGAKRTMQVAQRLYEGGYITYMRTDGIALAQEAIVEIRSEIGRKFGADYVPEKPRYYKNHVKNVQEAHEAIRPTHVSRAFDELKRELSSEEFRLYELIYKRTMACQMESALIDKTAIDIADTSKKNIFRSTGLQVAFAGFLKAYREQEESEENLLPAVEEGTSGDLDKISPEQHFTEPPPRYTEAGLVKKLETLGIGRPSTYATILSVLQEREYVKLVSKAFVPEDRGRLVTLFLENFFALYVDENFTADLENKLDDVSSGKLNWKKVLADFWIDFHQNVEDALQLKGSEVVDKIQELLTPIVFKSEEEQVCPLCHQGKLQIKIGRYGVFIGCSNYPECSYTHPLELGEKSESHDVTEGVKVKKGSYGFYVENDAGKKVALPRGVSPDSLTEENASLLLSLPKVLGINAETGQNVMMNIGRFGPYVGENKVFASIKSPDSVFTMTLERALELLSASKKKNEVISLGEAEGETVEYKVGRYGPYVEWKGLRTSVSKTEMPTLETALDLLKTKGKPVKKTAAKKTASKTTTKKTTAKKTATKTSTKKTTAKKAATKTTKTAVKKTTTKKTTTKTTGANK